MPVLLGTPGGPTRCLALHSWSHTARIGGTFSTPVQSGQYTNQAAGFSPNNTAVIMPRDGSVCGLQSRLYNAVATGSNTVRAYQNGVALPATALTQFGTTQFANLSIAAGSIPFAAGDCLDLRSTSSAWSQASGGIFYMLWVYLT